jgi:hypothetical protein
MKTSIIGFTTCIILTFSSDVSLALPKYASRTGYKCQSCHINPTGKGMRNEFGSTYGREDITLPTYKNLTDYDDMTTRLGPNLSFGGDYRSMFYAETQNHTNTFFQMQAAFYVDLRLNKKFQIYADKDFLGDAEIFGLARVLPLDGYVKIGRFIPAYGTKVDDHNYFIRGGPYNPGAQFGGLFPAGYPTGLRFGELSEDTGLELGFSPSIFTFSAGVFDGFPGVTLPTTGTKNKSVALRGDARFKLGGMNWDLGGSFYDSPSSSDRKTFYGVFGALTVFDDVTLTSELDYVEHQPGTPPTTVGLMWWHELNWMVTPGVDLKVAYESYDPDKDLQNGVFSQVTVGAELFILSGVELRPLYRFNINSLPNGVKANTNEFIAMFHFFI